VAIRVVLAEDNLLIREGVSHLLEAEDGIQVVASCGDLDALFAAVEAEQPDVVLTRAALTDFNCWRQSASTTASSSTIAAPSASTPAHSAPIAPRRPPTGHRHGLT
jgi:DNA-binding NarL/FixJ family response regulator